MNITFFLILGKIDYWEFGIMECGQKFLTEGSFIYGNAIF